MMLKARARNRAKPAGNTKDPWRAVVDAAAREGQLGEAARLAALSLAGQVSRLEARFHQYYRHGEEDAEARKAQSSPEALDKMGKCEKQLADLKEKLFGLIGLDGPRKAAPGKEIILKLEGFGEAERAEE